MDLNLNSNVLIICFDNLGDVVFASSLANALARNFPKINIDVWTKEYCTEIASRYPNVRQVFVSNPYWDRAPGLGKGSLSNFVKTWRKIRTSGQYDAILVASPNWRGALWARCLVAKIRSGFAGRKSRFFLTHQSPWKDEKPICETLGSLLEPLNCPPLPHTRLVAGAQLTARSKLVAPATIREGTTKNLIVVHGFAGNLRRCLKLTDLEALLVYLQTKTNGIGKIALMGTTTEISSISDILKRNPLVESINSDTFYSLMPDISLFIGHDSGPLHIAGAFSINTFGIYLPGTVPRTLPCGSGNKAVFHRANPDEVRIEQLCTELDMFARENKIF